MRFEVLKRSNLKRNIVIGLLVVGIISAIILNFTKAKYKNTESIPLVNGTINYIPYDLKMIAMYQEENGDYKEIEQMPEKGYSINEEKSYCMINNQKDKKVKLYTNDNGEHTISGLKKGSKCYLYFDKQQPLLAEAIIKDNIINTDTPNFGNAAIINEGIYKAEDNWGESFYFRGAVENNWIKFAGFYWRIIRINGDGSIRVIYNGTNTNVTGSNTMINSSQKFNSNNTRSEYAGYMYTSGQQHGNTTNSDIKTVLDKWYNSNLSSHANEISKEAGFCGDREMRTGYSWSSQPSGYSYYKAYERLGTDKVADLKCSNISDLYTIHESTKGNHALTNPIGLITADEISMAGGVYGQNNNNYYLYNNANYWTMTPASFSGYANVFFIYEGGNLNIANWSVANTKTGVRPVINLDSNVTIKSGNGTSSTPYEI